MTIQVLPHIINGYDDDDDLKLAFTVSEAEPTVYNVELREKVFTLESWREMSAAVEKAFGMFAEADAAIQKATHKEQA